MGQLWGHRGVSCVNGSGVARSSRRFTLGGQGCRRTRSGLCQWVSFGVNEEGACHWVSYGVNVEWYVCGSRSSSDQLVNSDQLGLGAPMEPQDLATGGHVATPYRSVPLFVICDATRTDRHTRPPAAASRSKVKRCETLCC